MTELEKLKRELEIYSVFVGEVRHAMHKVGWNNSRIESAFEDLDESLENLEEKQYRTIRP